VPQPLDVSFFAPLKRHWARVCHEYTIDHPGSAVTKFQFSSLFSKAWFLSIQPSTIMSGYRKVGIYPFDPTVIKLYEFSNTFGSAMKLSKTVPKVAEPHGSESSVHVVESDPGPSVTSVPSEDQMNLFQTRYENGYDILYEDPMYVEWLWQ